MRHKKKPYLANEPHGFTLVELIVVMVILAILSTIAFLSFSSQSAHVRDSVRLSDMSNIAEGLSIFNATAGRYPKPEGSVDITISGTILSHQGNASKNIIKMINLSADGGSDPLDGSYYTYSANADQTKMQLLGFLEDGSNAALSLIPEPFAFGFAEPTDYSKRFPYAKGDHIGILLSGGTLSPIQTYSTGADISSMGNYMLVISNDSRFSGTGTILKHAFANDSGLVGYWSFDEGIGQSSADLSNNGNLAVFSGTVIFTGGKLGNGITSDSDTGHVLIDFNPAILMGDFAISVWVLFRDFNNPYNQIIHTQNGNGISLIGKGPVYAPNNNKISFYLQQYNLNFRSNPLQGSGAGSVISTGIWHNLLINRVGQTAKMYVDGEVDQVSDNYRVLDYTGSIISLLNNYNASIGNKMNGSIDELRIYRRSLSGTEIQTLYDMR